MGSATELDYHLLLAHDLGFLDPGTYAARLEDATRIQKMLSSFIVKLRPAAALLVTARSTNGQ
jgi:four helix bundle protein